MGWWNLFSRSKPAPVPSARPSVDTRKMARRQLVRPQVTRSAHLGAEASELPTRAFDTPRSSETSRWEDLAKSRKEAAKDRTSARVEDEVKALAQQLGRGNPLLYFVAIFALAAELAAVLRRAAKDSFNVMNLMEQLRNILRNAGPQGESAVEMLLSDPRLASPELQELLHQAGLVPPGGASLPPEQQKLASVYAEIARQVLSDEWGDAQVDSLLGHLHQLNGEKLRNARAFLRHIVFSRPASQRKKLSSASEARLKSVLDRADSGELILIEAIDSNGASRHR